MTGLGDSSDLTATGKQGLYVKLCTELICCHNDPQDHTHMACGWRQRDVVMLLPTARCAENMWCHVVLSVIKYLDEVIFSLFPVVVHKSVTVMCFLNLFFSSAGGRWSEDEAHCY